MAAFCEYINPVDVADFQGLLELFFTELASDIGYAFGSMKIRSLVSM